MLLLPHKSAASVCDTRLCAPHQDLSPVGLGAVVVALQEASIDEETLQKPAVGTSPIVRTV